jgi:type I restriction enzyme, S subunit
MNTSISFQNSNIDWVGSIPSSWEMKKGKYLFSNKKEINSENQCDNLLSLTLFGVLNKDMESSEGLRPLNYKTYQIFEKNDMVFKLIDLENKKTSRVGLVHEKGIMSPVYIRLIPKENSLPKYFYYQYYDLYKKYIFNYLGSGVRSSLNPTDLMEIPLVFPPLPEQTQIVSFLDTKTQKIDELIEKTERKINLLKEKRTSLINHCVTKGLNPNVEMKDSGVEWIGEIPSGWYKTKVSRYCEVKDGTHDTPEYLDSVENTVPLVTSNSFVKGEIDFSKSKRISIDDYNEINKRSDVELNDIIMSMIGSNIGNRVLINTQNPFSIKNVCLFKTSQSKKLNPKYLIYLIDSNYLKYQVDFNQKGGGQPFLSLDELRNLLFPFPPLTEQTQIVEYLDEQTQKIDSTIEKETQRIELLKEYRQSLISEVVTGKVDVRDWKE